MPFTDIATVRQHLQETASLQDAFRDVPLPLTGVAPAALLHGNLRAGSVIVKGKELGAPQFVEIALRSQPQSLGAVQLIPDSVVVASDSSLGRIFTEHVDYHIDYRLGQITRLEAGAIVPDAVVAVWYYAYRIHVEGVDYSVDYEKGTIRRLAGSSIEDGQTVFADYETDGALLNDDQITNVIVEADDLILAVIDPAYHGSTAQALITAETYLAVSILCRIKAVATLQAGQDFNVTAARSWQELANRYEADAYRIAARYRTPSGTLSSPVRVTGGDRL